MDCTHEFRNLSRNEVRMVRAVLHVVVGCDDLLASTRDAVGVCTMCGAVRVAGGGGMFYIEHGADQPVELAFP